MSERLIGILGELMECGIIIYLWNRLDSLTKQIEVRK